MRIDLRSCRASERESALVEEQQSSTDFEAGIKSTAELKDVSQLGNHRS